MELSLYVNYGGTITVSKGEAFYLGGKFLGHHCLDPAKLRLNTVIGYVEDIGYREYKLYFRDYGERGLKELTCEEDVVELVTSKKALEVGMLQVYVVGDLGKKVRSKNVTAGASKNVTAGTSKKVTSGAANTAGVSGDVTNSETSLAANIPEGFETFGAVTNAEKVTTTDDPLAGTSTAAKEADILSPVEETEIEDPDYLPVGESETDDDLSDDDLSDDEEYRFARQNKALFKNYVPNARNVDFNSSCELRRNDHSEDEAGDASSEYATSDGDVNSDVSDENEDGECRSRRRKKKSIVYDPNSDHKQLEFRAGMVFTGAKECKAAVRKWAILNGYNLKNVRSNKKQVERICDENCKWRLYGSVDRKTNTFTLKRVVNGHTCNRKMENRNASYVWIGTEYMERVRRNPNMTAALLIDDVMDRYCVQISKAKAYRAKGHALQLLRGSVVEHYAGLRSYMGELMRVDPDGRFEFLLGENTTFKGFYVGFSGLRKGFKDGCRPIIGFDGCFLKTFLGGALLSAIAKDGNNQMFPICWAVVESETEETWTWFLQILFEDLGIIDGSGWSFISDQQKGLINAISKLTPHAEHRNCARHIYCNWKKNFKGQALKKIFWRAARSTNEGAHKKALEDMKAENEAAYDDFMGRGRNKFCKVFLSQRPKSDMIDNNVAETFNGYIVKARAKHIVDMLEEIRCSLMERMHTKITEMSGVSDSICPRIRKKLEQFKYFSRLCQVKPSLNEKYQISVGEDGFVVDMKNLTCTCGAWQLTGLPCPHACASIHWKKGDAATFVDVYYSVDRYMQAYRFGLEPMNGRNMWLEAEGYPIKPPLYKKMPGRPKKKRKRNPEEENDDPSRLGKHGILMTCTICNTFGHNKRTCPQRHNAAIAEKPPEKRGRPRKRNPSPIDPQRPSSSTKPPKLTPAEKRVRQKELRKVREGYGATTIEETGNRYERLPGQKRARFLGGPQLRSRPAATSEATSTITVPSYAQPTVSSSSRAPLKGPGRGATRGASVGSGRRGNTRRIGRGGLAEDWPRMDC